MYDSYYIDIDHPAVKAGAENMEYPHEPHAQSVIDGVMSDPRIIEWLRDTNVGRALKAEALADVAKELQHNPVDSRYLTEKALGHLVRATDIDKHTPIKEDGLPWDCVFGECDHDMDGDCPPVEITLCKECYRVARQIDPYYGEEGTGEIAWPCQVVRD